LLLQLVSIKALCRRANVEKIEAGPKGATLSFRDNSFANPGALVRYVEADTPNAKVRPDMRVVFIRDFDTLQARLAGVLAIMKDLAKIAQKSG